MTSIRFYRELSGNVFAAFVAKGHNSMGGYDGVGAVNSHKNSPVGRLSCSPEFLEFCSRVSERKARAIHPALFEVLDREGG
jgi:hypothetical protein